MNKLPIQYKNSGGLTASVVDVDDKSRTVKNVFSRMDILDDQNDVIDKSAFTKTLSEWGPNSKNRIWHLTDHIPNMAHGVGKFKELYVDGDMLIGITNIPETSLGNDILEHYKAGNITEHSIGYFPNQKETKNAGHADEYTLIRQITLYEGSSVLMGANELTPNLSVGKSYKGLNPIEKINIFKELHEQWVRYAKLFEKGKFSDFSLIEIAMKQIEAQIENLSQELSDNIIGTDDKSFQPIDNNEDEKFKESLLLIDLLLKTTK